VCQRVGQAIRLDRLVKVRDLGPRAERVPVGELVRSALIVVEDGDPDGAL
jgi:hypothetical protein